MHRYILTGAPGAGKTVLLRALERVGYAVVEEAATDVIALAQAEGVAEPWTDPGFIDAIVTLQRRRETLAVGEIVFFDRIEGLYQRRVFLTQGLGFITPTAARRISLDDAARFEAVHEQAYRELGYELVPIAPAPPAERAATIRLRITEP
jgi:predicted ATPase